MKKSYDFRLASTDHLHRWHSRWRKAAREKETPRKCARAGPNLHGCQRVLCLRLSVFSFSLTSDPCSRSDQQYVPPTKPYELSELVSDLVLFSRAMLKPQGRLVFFLPTVTEEYEEIDIDTMMCDGMEVIANSLQDFGHWGRRVRPTTTSTIRHYLTLPLAYNDKEVHW